MNKIILSAATALVLSSCGLYTNYKRPELPQLDSLYQSSQQPIVDSTTMASLSWRQVFTDPLLQELIEQGLRNNTNLRTAQLRVEQAEATLSAAKLAFLPSFALAPQVSFSDVTRRATRTETYSIPLRAEWQVDIFSSLRNAKKRSRALLEASQSYRQAVEAQIVTGIARSYYALVLLDEQLRVNEETLKIWRENVRTMQALMEAGSYNDAGVSSAEANLHSVEASVIALKQQIREAEHALGSILGTANPRISRGSFDGWTPIAGLQTGYPIALLSRRPDVRRAEQTLASAFYATNEARAAFYPNINITGILSVAGSFKGGGISDPVLSLIGSLTQPIFQRGKLLAGLKIAKSQYEEYRLAFIQSITDAGIEVNDRMTQVQTYRQLADVYAKRTAAVQRSEKATRLLQESGSSSYLEVLTAQQNLLSAQLQELSNRFNEIASTIALYQALGGGYELETAR